MNVQKLLEVLEKKYGVNVSTVATEFGEPGYSTDKEIILIGSFYNLDYDHYGRLEQVVELCNDDLYDYCPECLKVFRQVADSYSWTSSLVYGDGWWSCFECLDPVDYIEEKIGDPKFAVLPAFTDRHDLEDLGWQVASDDLDYGWHGGIHPEEVLDNLADEGDILFEVIRTEQFQVYYRVWTRKEG